MVTGIVTLNVIIGNEVGFLEFVNFVWFPFEKKVRRMVLSNFSDNDDDDFQYFTIAFQFPVAGGTLPAPDSDQF